MVDGRYLLPLRRLQYARIGQDLFEWYARVVKDSGNVYVVYRISALNG